MNPQDSCPGASDSAACEWAFGGNRVELRWVTRVAAGFVGRSDGNGHSALSRENTGSKETGGFSSPSREPHISYPGWPPTGWKRMPILDPALHHPTHMVPSFTQEEQRAVTL